FKTAVAALKWLAIVLPSPRMTTAEAVQYVAFESNWGQRRREEGAAGAAIIFAAFDELERGLRDWHWLDARGFPLGASIAEKLPPDYWDEVQLDHVDHLQTDRKPRSRTEKLPP